MKKIYASAIVISAVLFLVAAFLFLIRTKTKNPQVSQSGNTVKETMISGKKLSVEVAATPEKRALGLSGRESLCQNCAMLFVFEKPGGFSFWMKDMQFDLDIVWISGNEIVGIDKNVSHERGTLEVVRPSTPVDKVLEINAGANDNLDLKVGDKVDFSKAKP